MALHYQLNQFRQSIKENKPCQSYDQPPAPKDEIWRVPVPYGVPPA
jgi:hypothetical protein